jgi:hypothetical protein
MKNNNKAIKRFIATKINYTKAQIKYIKSGNALKKQITNLKNFKKISKLIGGVK